MKIGTYKVGIRLSDTIRTPTEDQTLLLLKEVAEALNETNDVMEAMDAILPRLNEVLGLSTAWAFRYDPRRSSFVEVGASGLPESLSKCDSLPLKTGWCECQDQLYKGELKQAINMVRCSRLRDAEGDTAGLLFHASIPLTSKGRMHGILNVSSPGRFTCSEPVLQLLTAVGNQVAVAFDRAGLIADERKRTRQLRAVSEIAAELTMLVQEQAVLQSAVNGVVHVLGYSACGILTKPCSLADTTAYTILVRANALHEERLQEYRYEVDVAEKLLEETERILLTDARSFLEVEIPHTELFIRVESSIANTYSDMDRDLMSALAGHIAAALENAKLHQRSLEDAKWLERRKLAADLHDSVSQQLFSATLLTKTIGILVDDLRKNGPTHTDGVDLNSLTSSKLDRVCETTERVQQLITASQEEMRSLIQALRPSHERGFVSMLRERLIPLQLQNQTRIHVSAAFEQEPELSFEKREALLGIVDEAIQNVLKHASAQNVYVQLNRYEQQLHLVIRDDGIGFSEATVTKGLGTTTMYERMQRVGGKLVLVSKQGRGTSVIADVPTGR